MVSNGINYNIVTNEEEFKKFKWGGMPEGTIEIYEDHLSIFGKSKMVKAAFGMIGSAIEGKGKPTLDIYIRDVDHYNQISDTSYDFHLTDGRITRINLFGFKWKDAAAALNVFLDHVDAYAMHLQHGQTAAPAPEKKYTAPGSASGADARSAYEAKMDQRAENHVNDSIDRAKQQTQLEEERAQENLRIYEERQARASEAAARLEAQRIEAERLEQERLAREREEAERAAKQSQILAMLAKEREEKEAAEAAKREQERLAKEREEAARLEAAKREQERLAKEREEAARLEAAKREQERLAKEREEKAAAEAAKREHQAPKKMVLPEEVICPSCGEKTFKGKFCIMCGQPLKKVCPDCGIELPDKARFCFQCGKMI